MSVAWIELGNALAPVIGILLACLLIEQPRIRTRRERRADRDRRRGWRPTPEQVAAADHWTCGRLDERKVQR